MHLSHCGKGLSLKSLIWHSGTSCESTQYMRNPSLLLRHAALADSPSPVAFRLWLVAAAHNRSIDILVHP